MPVLAAEKRVKNFKEIALGFSKEQALQEAGRCLQCIEPGCIKACPAGIKIPEFIKALLEGNGEKALKVIEESNYFPRVCGRICQQDMQCESACILAKAGNAINIGGLERFIGDNFKTSLKKKKTNGLKIAIVGSGPSGLTVALQLSQLGYKVDVLDSSKELGGVIKYGVPDFRLPPKLIEKELRKSKKLGISFEKKSIIGSEQSVLDLLQEYNAVFVGTGVGEAKMLEMPGKQLSGIIPAINFLIAKNLHEKNMIEKKDKVLVIGAGFVGLDAARTALRLKAKEVSIAALESPAKLRIGAKELKEAKDEGINFKYSLRAEEFLGQGIIEAVKFRKLKELDDGTIVDTDEFETIKANKVLIAIGMQPSPNDKIKQPLRTNDGTIHVDEHFMTSIQGVFAAGDAVSGPKTVIAAIATGKKAALAMHEYLQKNKTREEKEQQKLAAEEAK
jgi:glutamate synthase (NADPH/NADH) small chain